MESNDITSKLKFNENSNTEFTIALPERFSLGNWEVCLKSLILPSKIWNIYPETLPEWMFRSNMDISKHGEMQWISCGIGSFQILDLIDMFQTSLNGVGIPIKASFDSQKNRVNLKPKKELGEDDSITLYFNSHFAKMLGFGTMGGKIMHSVIYQIRKIII